MATTDARPVPRKGVAFRLYFAIRKSDGTLYTSWAAQDSEVSLDGGSFTDCTNEATEIGTSGCGYLDLTSSETNADSVVLKITTTGGLPLVVTLFPEKAGDYRADVTHFGGTAGTFSGGRPEVNTTHVDGTAWGSADLSATMKASVNAEADTALTDYGALKPTVPGRTLDVTLTGEAGIDWANVGGQSSAVALSGTTILLTSAYDAAKTAAPTAAQNASQVRTELAAELARIDVATSTRLASGSYSAPLDAAGIRTAVGLASANLDTQLSGISTITGRLGGMIIQDGLVYQFTANALELGPAGGGGGGGGEVTGFTSAAISQLSGTTIQLVDTSQTDNSSLDIVQGCDYADDDGTALTWNITDTANLSGATATLTLKRGATSEEFSGTVTDTGTNAWAVKVELTSTQTAALTAANDWTYSLALELSNGHTRALRLPGQRARVLAR